MHAQHLHLTPTFSPAPPASHPPADLIDLYKQSDAGATAALTGKLSVERSYSAKLDDVRAGALSHFVCFRTFFRTSVHAVHGQLLDKAG